MLVCMELRCLCTRDSKVKVLWEVTPHRMFHEDVSSLPNFVEFTPHPKVRVGPPS